MQQRSFSVGTRDSEMFLHVGVEHSCFNKQIEIFITDSLFFGVYITV